MWNRSSKDMVSRGGVDKLKTKRKQSALSRMGQLGKKYISAKSQEQGVKRVPTIDTEGNTNLPGAPLSRVHSA